MWAAIARGAWVPATIVLWILGSGSLLWVGGRFLAKSPKATYWRSVLTYVFALMVANVVWLAFAMLRGHLASKISWDWVMCVASLGFVAGLFGACKVVEERLETSFGKAVLALLPTLVMVLIFRDWVCLSL